MKTISAEFHVIAKIELVVAPVQRLIKSSGYANRLHPNGIAATTCRWNIDGMGNSVGALTIPVGEDSRQGPLEVLREYNSIIISDSLVFMILAGNSSLREGRHWEEKENQ